MRPNLSHRKTKLRELLYSTCFFIPFIHNSRTVSLWIILVLNNLLGPLAQRGCPPSLAILIHGPNGMGVEEEEQEEE